MRLVQLLCNIEIIWGRTSEDCLNLHFTLLTY